MNELQNKTNKIRTKFKSQFIFRSLRNPDETTKCQCIFFSLTIDVISALKSCINFYIISFVNSCECLKAILDTNVEKECEFN